MALHYALCIVRRLHRKHIVSFKFTARVVYHALGAGGYHSTYQLNHIGTHLPSRSRSRGCTPRTRQRRRPLRREEAVRMDAVAMEDQEGIQSFPICFQAD